MQVADFSERLNDLIKFEGLTSYKLKQATGIPLKSIHNWIKGIYYPSPKYLFILADYFKVSTDYVLGLDNREEEEGSRNDVSMQDSQKILIVHLNEYLAEKKISKKQLSKKLGTGQGALSRWFKIGSMPETAMLIKIAMLLDKPLDELLGRK